MCKCRTAIDEKLKEKNARLAFGFTSSEVAGMALSPPLIQLEKIDRKKRGNPPILLSTYCPFCGNRFDDGQRKTGHE